MSRTPADVAGRLLALGALIWRAQLEHHRRTSTDGIGALEQRNEGLKAWIDRESIPLSGSEAHLFARRLGDWEEHSVYGLIWRFEAAVPLLWATGALAEMPSWTTPVPGPSIMEPIDIGGAIRPPASLRSQAECAAQRDVALFWNWRARTERFRRSGTAPPPGDSFEATVARAVQAAVEQGIVDAGAVQDGDVSIDGVRYCELDERPYLEVASLAQERHHALCWLAGSADWDEVDTST